MIYMIKSYEQFKSKIFNNKDQLRDMLNILYNVDKPVSYTHLRAHET